MRHIITFLAFTILFMNAHGQGHNRHYIDSAVLSWNLTDMHDADDLTDTLTSIFNTDSDKVRAIYFWVTQYISYDLKRCENNMDIILEHDHDIDKDGNLEKNRMIKQTLRRKRGVCQDYADLFAYMCNYANIKCEVITGLGVSAAQGWALALMGNGSNHAWNAVLMDNKWYLIDPTWASGYFMGDRFKRRRDDYYYLTPPAELIKNHFPDEDNWQLLSPVVDRKAFLAGVKAN
jgi:transglutaminase/protease-like cytokinesis protein 3